MLPRLGAFSRFRYITGEGGREGGSGGKKKQRRDKPTKQTGYEETPSRWEIKTSRRKKIRKKNATIDVRDPTKRAHGYGFVAFSCLHRACTVETKEGRKEGRVLVGKHIDRG